jgi:hypothetical protein
MNTFNNFSPLAFREKSQKATYKKWYAYGKEFALPFSTTELPPFQFTVTNLPSFDPTTVEVFLVNEATGVRSGTGIKTKVDTMDEHNSVLYVSPGSNVYAKSVEPGVYRAEFTIPKGETYVSTPICVTEGIETNTNFVKLEYWNDEKLAYPNGFVTTGTDNDFKFQMYIPTTFFKPKYEFEEEITKRAGYKFLELQTCNKVFGFNFLAPEYICDALRLVRLSDYIRFTHDGEYYNALNFEYNPDWQDNGYLAAIECQFETDTIIQKLPSFNRRDRESFYNALLADIDTPILFSPDVVGLYYREYKQGEPTIKGKLIRELSPIDLIDENTTIAVDMGAGEARKFNLYRMLEGYISKNHEDVTEFLLSLRGGVNIGTPNTSGEYPASVDRDGNAKLKDIQGNDATLNNVTGKDATFKTVETGFLTVNKTSATIDGMGNANVNDLTARGDSMLRSDVYTGSKNGSHTGKITKEGQLQYLSAIIYEFLSSETFVPGFLGEGFKIWLENGNWHIECDNLTVRQTMNIFELLIQKIRSVNGAIVVSQSNGKLSAVEEVGTQYKLTTGEEFPTFQEGDLVRCQTFAGYQGAGLTFDFTQFAKYDYSGGVFDSSLIDVTPDSISFNLNDTGNSGFAFYKFSESSPTPIEIPSFTLTLEGGYPGMMAFAAGLDSNDSPVEGVGVLLQNGDNVIPAIKAAQGIHNFAITITGDSGHGDGKVTVKQKKAAGSAPNNSLVKFYWVEVKAVDGASFFADKAEFNGVVPAVGDEVVQMGNTKNAERQALIYITAQESGKPYIEILNGVKTKSLTGTDRTRLGDLSNIVDPDFTGEAAVKGTGFYSTNAFLKGIFVLRNGKRVEDEIKIAKDAADKAAQDAANAAQSAQEAKDRLNKWADDGFISPTEKPALIDEGKRIQAEYLQIKANADKYGVLVAEYTEAYNNYLNELRYHSAAAPEDIAVRPELVQSQTAYYDKRNGALNAIADAAKGYVDEADKKLKDYLDTEITAIPGKIELAVRSMKTADVNLLKGSYEEKANNSYRFAAYNYDTPVIDGKEYTLTVCYTIGSGNTNIGVYSNVGTNRIANLTTKGERVIESTKVTMKGYKPGEPLSFYQFPNGAFGSKVHWAVLTDGNLGVTSWIPSTSEKNVGLKNLCSFKRIVDSGFTYASDYKDDGTFFIDLVKLNAESHAHSPIKDMFGLTYDPNKRYYIFCDYFSYDNPPTSDNQATLTIFVNYTDGSRDLAVYLGKDKYLNNYFLTNKPIKSLSGTYGYFFHPRVRLGVYETNFPVSWSPAPEDQLYQSVKYTDTQILAVDGKIALSVKTQLEKSTIGGNNLLDGSKGYWFNESDYLSNVELVRDGDAGITRIKGNGFFNSYKRWMPVDKSEIRNGKEYTVGIDINVQGNYYNDGYFWVNIRRYEDSQEIMLAHEQVYIENKPNWVRYYVTVKTPDSGNPNDWLFLCGFSGNNETNDVGVSYYYRNINMTDGSIGASWSPSANDTYNKSVEYTTQQISIVEGKISLEVSKEIQNTQFGGNNLYSYTSSQLNQMSSSDMTIKRDLANHGFHLVGNSSGNSHIRIPNIIPPITGKYTVSGWIRGSQNTTPGITIDVCDSDTYRVRATPDNNWSFFKHTFDVSKNASLPEVYNFVDIEEISWAYIWVKDFKVEFGEVATAWSPNEQDPVYKSAEYTNSKIDVTNQSITAAVQRISATENRLTSAELKLTDTSAKLSVVEGKADGAQSTANSANSAAGAAQSTANAANSLAGTANNKADATNNGLVETGINITSRKIVLKSDNVLFQNNAGQQTAALNANGRLSANVIEAGEVVANGFAAQRITTGNLTVTDGAVIAGMTITGGVLTGKNINITNGARVGSFTISSGIFSAQEVPAGIQMTLAGNAATFDSSGVRVENNSGGYALTTTGKGKIFLTGSDFWVQCKDVDFMGAQTWKAPGVFYACTILANGAIGKTWGNPDFHITRVIKNSTGRYTVYTTGSNGDYFVMITGYNVNSWLSTTVEPYSEGEFTYKVFDVNNGMADSAVIIYFCGMVR